MSASLSVRFEVPGEPVPCGRPEFGRRGKFVTTRTPDKTRAYEHTVGLVARAARPSGWRCDWAAYELEIHVYRAIQRGDGDNYAKAVADGCTGILWANDSAIVRWVIEIHDDAERPRAEVRATMLGELDVEAARRERRKTKGARTRRRGLPVPGELFAGRRA